MPTTRRLLFLALSIAAHRAPAQDAPAWRHAYLVRPGKASGLVVLLPGLGSTASEFVDSGMLARRLSHARVALVALWPATATLYFDEASVAALDAAVSGVAREVGVRPSHIVVGGSSVGGTGAVQLAERCAAHACVLGGGLAGVFTVDAPLDFERIWRGEELTLRRAAPSANLAESRLLLDAIGRVLGGSPAMRPDRYRALSPLAAFAADGGRAALLRATPIRAYTEPDVQWWIRERGLDYYAMNAVDAAALINQLRLLGNRQAELITTSGRGVRPDGSRHPHSWSIVEPDDLATWLTGLVGLPEAAASRR